MSRIKGVRLTANQKKRLSKLGHDPSEYLFVRIRDEVVLFVHRDTGELLEIPVDEMEGGR